MAGLYLTPSSIGFLTQFILAGVVAGYFWILPRRSEGKSFPLPTTFLAGAFTAFACAALFLFLNDSLYPDLGFYVMPLESVAVGLFVTLLLQFAYRFPSMTPRQRLEARIALGLTVLYVLWETGIAIWRYARLAGGVVVYRPPFADIPLAAILISVALVFLRQTVRAETDDRPPSVWCRFWQPRTRIGRAMRAPALLDLMPLLFETVDLLKGYLFLPHDAAGAIHSLGILLTLAVFALIYLNQLPEVSSLMVKLRGITLASFLPILAGVAVSTSTSIATASSPTTAHERTLPSMVQV